VTDRDLERFTAIVTATAETFGETVSKARLSLLFNLTADLTIEQFERAMLRCSRMSRFFPRPADILDAAGSDAISLEDRAELALRAVEQHNDSWSSVVFEDRTIHAVVEQMGGWLAVCDAIRSIRDTEYGFWQRDFRRIYAVCARSGWTGPDRLAGQIETVNGAKGLGGAGDVRFIGSHGTPKSLPPAVESAAKGGT
jgi:hypothetical protein